jgi:hypothetical protein
VSLTELHLPSLFLLHLFLLTSKERAYLDPYLLHLRLRELDVCCRRTYKKPRRDSLRGTEEEEEKKKGGEVLRRRVREEWKKKKRGFLHFQGIRE